MALRPQEPIPGWPQRTITLPERVWPMHILLVHQVFLSTDEPGNTQHYEFARHLTRSGHRVTILAGTRSYLTGRQVSSAKRETLAPGLEVLRCPVWSSVHRSFIHRTIGFLSFMLSSLWRGLGVRHVDLVWSTSPPLPQICTAWALAWLKRVPHVFEVRDPWPSVAIELGVLRSHLLIALACWAERFLYRHSKRIIVNSPGFIPYLRQAGVPEAKIALVPNGVDTTLYDLDSSGEPFRLAHGLQGKFVVLYAGAHGLSNDLVTLLQAADRLRQDRRLIFVLLGDGKEKPSLMAQAGQMGLENVLFLPAVPKADMPGVLAAADCGVAILRPIPLFATTYPNKVFDYMAAGRPVVLAIDGVIRDVVEGAGAGLAVPPGNPEALAEAVRLLAADPDKARQMGRRGRTCVEQRFDRRHLAQQLEEVLLEAGRPCPRPR
jgi:glycosyltransferase involved in cell wall biosynthesis